MNELDEQVNMKLTLELKVVLSGGGGVSSFFNG